MHACIVYANFANGVALKMFVMRIIKFVFVLDAVVTQ